MGPPPLWSHALARFRRQPLQRQLLAWLLVPQLVLWGAAAVVTYQLAVGYANRGIDASLLQATRSLARQVKPVGNGLFIDFPRAAQDIIEADPDDRVFYMVSTPPGQFILGNRQLPQPALQGPPRLGEPYFYDARIDRLPIRLSALYMAIGEASPGSTQRPVMLVQIARSQASREALARGILRDTVLPLSGLMALMTMIVWAGIRAGLAPLAAMRAQVEHRAPNDLTPLAVASAPSELRALAGAINSLLAAVQESVSGQRRFISNAAHQLRTPLAGLKSQTEIALGATQEPALAARLQRVHESAVRSAHLVNQLLTLTRAEPEAAGALPRQPVDLRALAAAVTADHVPRALQASIDLGMDESDNDAPVWVLGAELLLREALINLIDNAIRYAGRGAEVTVSVHTEGERVRLSVRDNGPGLDAEQRQAAFGRFVRVAHDGPGCGLGLAIVREIAERHGGQAMLRAAQPRGLVAELYLPRYVTDH